MKEQKMKTQIGSEIDVTVFFDYTPEQKETYFDEGICSLWTVNAVLVDGDESKDILEVLSDAQVEILSQECEEYLLD